MKKFVKILIVTLFLLFIFSGCDVQNSSSEFTINSGILISYNGKSQNVIIPDDVYEISDDAFKSNPHSKNIASIELGQRTNKIGNSTLVHLPSLTSIIVPDDNINFVFSGTMLASNNDDAIFCISRDEFSFSNFFDIITNSSVKNFFDSEYKLIFKNSILYINSNGVQEPYEGQLVKIEAYNQNTPLSTNFLGNHSINWFEADGYIVFEDIVQGTMAKTVHIFGDNFLYSDDFNFNGGYNNPSVVYHRNENGNLAYKCRPYKYCDNTSADSVLAYCVGLDELFEEYGTVRFENTKPIHTLSKTKTVIEHYENIDELKDVFNNIMRDTLIKSPNVYGIENGREIDTLEKFLHYNSERYEKFNTDFLAR